MSKAQAQINIGNVDIIAHVSWPCMDMTLLMA